MQDHEAKLAKVQDTLEQLMTKDSLQEDAFIQMNMNPQMYIPLCILAGHHKIEELGTSANISTLLEASLRSEHLDVDKENMLVKPVLKTKRNTVILRELPDGVTEEELQKLFDKCPSKLESVKPDVNHTAFVTFETDTAAQDAALWLRSQKLGDAPVKCAIKSEQFLRSFMPMPSMPPQYGVPAWAVGTEQQVMWGWPQQWAGQENWAMEGWPSEDGKGAGKEGKGKGGFEKGGKGQEEKGGSFEKGTEKGSFDKGKGKSKGKGRRKGEGPMGGIDREMAQMEAMQQQAYQAALEAGDQVENEEVDFGYKHEFRKYSRQEIIEACSSMDEAHILMPDSFKKMEVKYPDLALFRQSPNKDWAPLPTPMSSFASFLGGPEKRTGSTDEKDGDTWGESDRSRKERANTWAPRTGRSESADEGDWDWDAWPEGGKGKKGVWGSRRRGSWDERYSEPEKKWVAKASTGTGEEDEKDGKAVGKRTSWADKVKNAPQQKWQAKVKPAETEQPQEAPEPASTAEPSESAEKTGEAKASTWADKVRSKS